ncbi:MAG: hypothetical protein EB067_06260 [Actinobacteria bacterium]|nr:hypothetical protein [Actinomycetota bacterium]
MVDSRKEIEMITLEPAPQLSKLATGLRRHSTFQSRLTYLNSGKSAISLLIEYFKFRGRIKDKNGSVFIPKWVGSPVYQEIAGSAIPSTSPEIAHDIYMMYHQYGFSQDIKKYISSMRSEQSIIIEDCAHRIEGPVLNETQREYHYSIFSFNKFHFCMLLGGIDTNDLDFSLWLNSFSKNFESSILLNLFKVADEFLVHSKNFNKSDPFSRIRKMTFSVYSSYPKALDTSVAIHEKNIERELVRRKNIYSYFAEKFGPAEILPKCWVTTYCPYAIPIKGPLKFLQEIQNILQTFEIRAPINHFDFNLNNLDPAYEKSLILPCHSQLTDVQVEFIRDLIFTKLPSGSFSR